jgi:hypothetical protein
MRYCVPAFVVLALLAGPKSLFSADKAKETPKPAPLPALSDNPVLKEVKFHNAPLSEVVGYLRQSFPRFKAVVVPDPQCSDPDPALPNIELKDIDLQQFLEVLKQTLPQLTIEGIDGEIGPVCLFKVAAPEGAQPPRLEVYRLSPLIPAGQSDRTKALNDILSLVQAALEAQGSASNVLMKVHEATGTLIFRGNPTQIEVVQRALKALEPTAEESQRAKLHAQIQADRERKEDRSAQLEKRLREAEDEAGEARKRISAQATEIETLKARLAARSDKSP